MNKWKTRTGRVVIENGRVVEEVNQPWEEVGAKKITHPKQIIELAKARRSVYDRRLGHSIPAAFIQNYQLVRIMQMIDAGILYEYEK